MLAALAGCRAPYGADSQEELAKLYYSGKVKQAAEFATQISEDEADESDAQALLWHLEAGNANLDAGRIEESREALDRAEAILYDLDFDCFALHFPGNANYDGMRSDRLLLHLLKGLDYFSQGLVEDFLVEIRRMRASQFRYLTSYDTELRDYDADNAGKPGPTRRMKTMRENQNLERIFSASGVVNEFAEFSKRRRPELSILFNPLAFYLSAVGYYFDNTWDEGLIDLEYLGKIDPSNPLYQRDRATLYQMLGEKIPPDLKNVNPWPHSPGDQVVYVILGEGKPDGWKKHSTTYRFDNDVPTDWSFSLPDWSPFTGGGFKVATADGVFDGVFLADISDIMREEYWQWMFPRMTANARSVTESVTKAHEAAKKRLAELRRSKNYEGKSLAIAAAELQVAATSRASVNHTDWRRWVTVPRHYSIAHVPLTADKPRKLAVTLFDRNGRKSGQYSFSFGEDVNRAIVYIREIGGKYFVQRWESME
ncbi:MAG: hypothetical protein PHI35_04155 [Victivallaceae bacterium]|nr:hypothetical protein [Victivallaceae bacterium]